MEDNPLDQPARTDHQLRSHHEVTQGGQQQRQSASSTRRTRTSSQRNLNLNPTPSSSSDKANPLIQPPPPLSTNDRELNPSQSSGSSSQASGSLPHQPEPIATRTRGALRASISGTIEGIETASSASAGSRLLDQAQVQAQTEAEAGEELRNSRSGNKKRKIAELGSREKKSSRRRTRTDDTNEAESNNPTNTLSAKAKGKQPALAQSDSSLSEPDTDTDGPPSEPIDPDQQPHAKKRPRRSVVNKTASTSALASASASSPSSASANKEEEAKGQESGSTISKRRMSGKGKAKGQTGAAKKHSKPPKRERVASGSGNGRRNRGSENDLSPYEDDDVNMDDVEPPRPRSRKSSNKQAREQELAASAAAVASSSTAPGSGIKLDDSDEDSDVSEPDKPEAKPSAALLAAMEAVQGLAGSSGAGGSGSAAAAALAAATGRLGGAGDLLSALGGMYVYGGLGGGGGLATKWKTMLNNLRSPEAQIRLAALEQASMELAMSMEEMLAGRFPTEAVVKEFVAILNRKPNIDKTAAPAVEAAPVHEAGGDDWEDEDSDLRAALAMSRGDSGMDEMDSEVEVQADLHACRCLVNLMEALPGSTNVIVHAGAVPALCSKLQNISFIELAAQVINTLEKIAKEQPAAIVRAGGMQSLLNFIDFFDKYDQRSAVSAVASCCKRIAPENFHHVQAVFPKLTEILAASEPKLVEAACTAIIRTIESYKHKPDLLDQLIDKAALTAIKPLILPSGGAQTLPPAVYTELLRALSTAAKASVTVTMACIEADLPGSMYYVLTGVLPPDIVEVDGGVSAAPPSDAVVQQNIAQRPKGQVEEALVLLTELLPPTPKDGVFDPRNYSERMFAKYVKAKSKVDREKAKNPEGPALVMEDIVQASSHASTAPVPAAGQTPEAAMAEALGITIEQFTAVAKAKKEAEQVHNAKTALFQQNLESVSRLIQIVIPVLVSVYSAASAATVRAKILSGLSRAIAFSDAPLLRSSLKMVPLAGLLSAIITSNEPENITLGMLQISELLLDKVPGIYMRSFYREGIFQGICALADQPLSPAQQQRSKDAAAKRGTKSDDKQDGSATGTPSPEAVNLDVAVATDIEKSPAAIADTEGAPSAPAADVPSPAAPVDDSPDRKPEPALLQAIDRATALTAAARKISSVPVDPRDMNIMRCKVLRIKKGLDTIDTAVTEKSGATQAVKRLVEALSDNTASRAALSGSLDEIAALFIGCEEPISSYELLHTGLLGGLLAYATEERKISVADRRRLLYERFTLASDQHPATAFTEMVSRLQEALSRSEKFEVELPVLSSRAIGTRNTGETPLDNLIRHMRVRVVADVESEMPRHYKDIIVTVAAVTPISQVQGYLRARSTGAAPGGRGGLAGSFYESYLGGAEALRERVRAAESRLAAVSAGSGAGPSQSVAAAAAAAPTTKQDGETNASAKNGKESLSQRRSSARLRGKAPETAETEESAPESQEATPAAEEPIDETEVISADGDRVDGEDDVLDEAEDGHDDEYDEDIDDDGGPIYEDDIMDDEEEDERPADRTVVLSLPEEGTEGKPEAFTPDGTRVATPTGSGSAAEASKQADLPPKAGSYAAAVRAPPQDWHFQFSINGQTLQNGETMYGAITRTQASKNAKISIWDSQPTMRYKRVPGPPPVPSGDSTTLDYLEPASINALPDSLLKDGSTASILRMLRVLHSLNEDYAHTRMDLDHTAVDQNAFINQKLTAKFIRQLEELVVVLSDTLPSWALELPRYFPFLFPFEARFNYLQTTAFGYSRIVHKAIAASPPSNSEQRRNALADLAPRHTRVKVRLARENILFSATRVMELYAPQPGTLEIEYFEEIGTGLGPTLEFYTLVSRAFATKDLGIWRDDDVSGDGDYVQNLQGLFPSPIGEAADSAASDASPLTRFTTLGLFAGKALLDSRIVDLNFNKVFLKAVLGQPIVADVETLRMVDPALAQSIAKLEKFAEAKFSQYGMPGPEPLVDGVKIEELGLDFTLPGYPEVVLKPGGAQVDVTGDNVDEYIALVLEFTLIRGIAKQVEAFRRGFSKIFPVAHLSVFSPSELVLLFGDPDEDWSRATLEKSIKIDHGYTPDSPQIRNLIEVMLDFGKEERRAFLQFTTGAPKLPIGGFKGLSPPFTVVYKAHEPPYQADHYLPSVMTCVSYFKLPRYSTKEVLRVQVTKAMHEGAGAFWLS